MRKYTKQPGGFSLRCDGMSRRDFVRVGGLTSLGFGLGDMFRWREAGAAGVASVEGSSERAAKFGRAKSCILIWLDGGPSHLETFDPKPDAPAEVRGPLESIATAVPGLHLSECLPATAKLADRVTIIRSMTSPLGEHNFGTHYLMTGYQPTPALEYPAFGSVIAHERHTANVLPSHIAVPHFRVGGSGLAGNGYLPAPTRPFSVGGDPAKPNFQVRDLDFFQGLDLERLDRRRQFVKALEEFGRQAERVPGASDPAIENAYQLVASASAKAAFDLQQESVKTRQRYGGRTIGQSCLLARRLVERGVPFVTVTNTGWDTHDQLYTRLKEGYAGAKVPVGLAPSLDQALAGLIRDLEDRRLLDETLIVVMGEFGRTPKLNTQGGRDHWPRVFSVLLAGGGAPGGLCVGSSDAVGESPEEAPVTPADLAATIYTLLGLDPSHQLHTADGRPVRLTPETASPVKSIVG